MDVVDSDPRLLVTENTETISEGLRRLNSKKRKQVKSTTLSQSWTRADDASLNRLVKKYRSNWESISEQVPESTPETCIERWSEMNKRKRGPWSSEEDKLLKELLLNTSSRNWTEIASKVAGRSSKQCRERWFHNLDPKIKKETWTIDEDQVLISTHKEVGNKWAKIASRLPGRTENAVKTRFKAIIRAYLRSWSASEDAKLLALQKELGCNWGQISKSFPKRTKNAVKIRYRNLQGGTTEKPPAPGAPEQALSVLAKDLETLKKPNWKLFQSQEELTQSKQPVKETADTKTGSVTAKEACQLFSADCSKPVLQDISVEAWAAVVSQLPVPTLFPSRLFPLFPSQGILGVESMKPSVFNPLLLTLKYDRTAVFPAPANLLGSLQPNAMYMNTYA